MEDNACRNMGGSEKNNHLSVQLERKGVLKMFYKVQAKMNAGVEKDHREEIEMRHICTKDDPWTKEKARCGQHPDAVHIRDEYDQSALHDDYEVYLCPHCGLQFYVTIPN